MVLGWGGGNSVNVCRLSVHSEVINSIGGRTGEGHVPPKFLQGPPPKKVVRKKKENKVFSFQ